jgi:flagellar basal body-associated protein FliL
MAKRIENQYVYKKQIGFTLQQKTSLETLAKYNVNVNDFIRSAIKEKILREWKTIKEKQIENNCPF